MRRRLMLAMVGLVAVVLVIAGAGSLILTRNAARHQAEQQLVSEVDSLTSSTISSKSLAVLRVVRKTLKLEDADVIAIDRFGAVHATLPEGLTAQDIDVAAVQSGQTTSGRKGNTVYAVAPVTLSQQELAHLRAKTHVAFEGTFAVLLTRNVGGLGPSWGYFIVAGGAALLIAALVAWQMSRRMARPLVEAMEATGRIASGELDSRVPVRPNDYPEFASLAGSINGMAQSLEDGRTRERQLLLAVSHDLRTPLTSIRGFAEAIHDGAIDDNARAADVIIAESRRLERLVGDLLDLTKLEAHQTSIALRPTDATEVVTDDRRGVPPRCREERAGHCAAGERTRGRGSCSHAASRGGRPGPAGAAPGQPLGERHDLRPLQRDRGTDGGARVRGVRHHGGRRRTWDRCPGTCSGCSSVSTARTGARSARWGQGSAWRSWPSWRRPWGAPYAPSRRSTTAAGRASW